MPARKGYYAYAIIETKMPRTFSCEALGSRAAYCIEYRDLAVVVTDAVDDACPLDRDSMRRHNQVISRIMAETTVIPIRFGSILASKADARGLLRSAYSELKEDIARLAGKIELGLKVVWKKETFAVELERQFPDLRELKAYVLSLPAGSAYQATVELGERVALAADELNDTYLRDIFEPLKALAADARLNKQLNERMVFNAAYLVDAASEATFDGAVDALYNQYCDRFEFKYSGPWPPYNFVSVSMNEADDREMD